MKVRDVIGLIERHGWKLVRQRGSHRQLKHPFSSGLVTIAGSANDDLEGRDFVQLRRRPCVAFPFRAERV